MAQMLKIMISSTARDLPKHREQVMQACLRQGMFYPQMMEHLTAVNANALEASLKMVDAADIYLGVFAFRYGYVPEGHSISITEAEYNRAVERNIPRLIFIMSDTHPKQAEDIESGEGAEKIRMLKERIQKDRVVGYFSSPEDLRALVIQALIDYRQTDIQTFHYIGDIPASPESYVAHPYTLLQTPKLIGRQTELKLITDWAAQPQCEIYQASILSIVAIGGMGKSALAWEWFNGIAPLHIKELAGRIWWSFYESDATFENFVARALAYVSKQPLNEIQAMPIAYREATLLTILDHRPFVLVMDGLERILIAYARMDASRLSDEDYDKKTDNFVANAHGFSPVATPSFTSERLLRKTADPRAGSFIRKLSKIKASKILVTTRLYPAELQSVTGETLDGCEALYLHGLADHDALELWHAIGVRGSHENLLPLFNRVENHPLVIQSLAGEVAHYRRHPGDFDKWKQNHPDFNPFTLPLVQVKSHVLAFALQGLQDKSQHALYFISAFRMPVQYDTIAALLITEGKIIQNEQVLDMVLTELEDRGLVGWDKRANRYDLHPIVRGVVWSSMGNELKQEVYENVQKHFEALPKISHFLKVNKLEDLTHTIELYNALIELKQYDKAAYLFADQLNHATQYRLNANRQRIELLEMLFPNGIDQLPQLNDPHYQAYVLNSLAISYMNMGQLNRSIRMLRLSVDLHRANKNNDSLNAAFGNLSYPLRLSGALYDAEVATRQALIILRELKDLDIESICLFVLGSILATRGNTKESEVCMKRSLKIAIMVPDEQAEGVANAYLAKRALWLKQYNDASLYANKAWTLANRYNLQDDLINAAHVQGEAALKLNDFSMAEERLNYALSHARAVNSFERELPAIIALAELRRRQNDLKASREMLDDLWEMAERGPYRLYHADACNLLADIERDAGNYNAAINAATKAYELSWCDGPPYAYQWGLETARKHLEELKSFLPQMIPFDPGKFEPMPIVEIEPPE